MDQCFRSFSKIRSKVIRYPGDKLLRVVFIYHNRASQHFIFPPNCQLLSLPRNNRERREISSQYKQIKCLTVFKRLSFEIGKYEINRDDRQLVCLGCADDPVTT